MKRPLFAAALVFVGTFSVQAQVSSDAVGVVSVTVPAQSDAPVGLPLNRAPALQTTVKAVAGNLITTGAPLSAGQFLYASPSQPDHFYAQVKTTVNAASAVSGKWFEVTGNDATTLTVVSDTADTVQSQGLAAGDVLQVIPFWTLQTLFPHGQGLTATADMAAPQDQVFFTPQTTPGTNLAHGTASLYFHGTGSADGWYDSATGLRTDDDVIYPDTCFIVRNRGVAKPVALVGSTAMSARTSSLVRLQDGVAQDNLTANPFPVPLTLRQSQLVESGAFQVTTDKTSPQDLLLVYTGAETSYDTPPSKTYFYSIDPQLGTGWFDASNASGPLDNTAGLLPAGGAFVVRKAAGPVVSLNWKVPFPY